MGDERLAALWGRGRPAVMGIVNVTPDSFSDGGRFLMPDAAVAHAERLVAEGADAVDVGGESTRPGAVPVGAAEEAARVVPVIAALARRFPALVLSVDTSKAEVAAAALDGGAVVVNDVSAGRDAAMLPLVAARGAGVILMHMRGEPRTMLADTAYADVVAEVHAFLGERAAAATAAGVAPDRVILDPGIGFGKDLEGNLRLLAALPDLAALGHPVAVGVSRKSFIFRLTGAAVDARLPGSLAALGPAAALPRVLVRVHDVAATVQFLEVLAAVRRAA
jgi:dihydropteroate synthase